MRMALLQNARRKPLVLLAAPLAVLLALLSVPTALRSTDQPLVQPGSNFSRPSSPAQQSPQVADDSGDTAASQRRKDEARPMRSADADEATLEFVREHQPELAKLLEFLKSKQSDDYREAMAESAKVRQRLQSIKGRDAELYEVELAIWKNAAQLRLLAASLSVKSKKVSDADRARLKELITRENELTIKRLELDKARAESRLAQLSQQLTKRQEQTDNVIAKGLKTWEHRIEKSSGKLKSKTTDSSKQKPTVETSK
jgi:hypothetical protein